MPSLIKKTIIWTITCVTLVINSGNPLSAKGSREISTYYIRLDIKSTNHRITGSKLTMVPAEREFRRENFSPISISRLVTTDQQASRQYIENQAKKNALIQILEQNGLKTITTMNQDTIISYEGVVLTPISLKIAPYTHEQNGYPYIANVYFASLAFPDQWKSLQYQFKVKKIFEDFILLFK